MGRQFEFKESIRDIGEHPGFDHLTGKSDPEEFIEYGRFISRIFAKDDESPVIPTDKRVDVASKLSLGPSRNLIYKALGGIDSLQAELGFINVKVTREWTDQDWIDYGVWLSHALGSPEKPVMPGSKDFREAAKLGIGPGIKTIYDKFGGFPQYLQTVGFETKLYGTYGSWTRQDFVDNGTWISQMIGEEGKPKMPTSTDIVNCNQLGLCPSSRIITDRFHGSFIEYQDALGYVTDFTLEKWTDQDWIDNGIWFSHMLGKGRWEPKMPTNEDLNHGGKLGLTPTYEDVLAKFGSIYDYQKALGFSNPYARRNMTNREVLLEGFWILHNNDGRKPGREAYREAGGIAYDMVVRRFGSLSNFYERLGLPDYKNWGAEEVLRFGLQYADKNSGIPPNSTKLDKLSLERKGPTSGCVTRSFGSIAVYKEAVAAELPKYLELKTKILASVGKSRTALADHMLNNYLPGQDFADKRANIAKELGDHLRKPTLDAIFKRIGTKGLTIWWDNEDFMEFGSLAFEEIEPEQLDERVSLLQRANLMPHMDEIEELFGDVKELFRQSRIYAETLAAEATN